MLESLDEILAQAVADSGADMGNIQLLNPQSGTLQIVSSLGFSWRFLSYFDSVHQGQAACGRALAAADRIVIEEVLNSPVFDEGSRAIVLGAGARSVQSTPLRDSQGQVIGMLSTHRRTFGMFGEEVWAKLDTLAERAAELVENARMVPGTLPWSMARSRMMLESAKQMIHSSERSRREDTP